MAFAPAFVQSFFRDLLFQCTTSTKTAHRLPTTVNYTEGAASFSHYAKDTITDDACSAKGKMKQEKCIWSTPVTIFQTNVFVKAKVACSLVRKPACIFCMLSHLEYLYFQKKPHWSTCLASYFHHLHRDSPSAGYFTSHMSSKNKQGQKKWKVCEFSSQKNKYIMIL